MSRQQVLIDVQETIYNSRNPVRRWLHRSRREWIVAQLHKLGGRNTRRALEVGPGSGIYLPVLSGLAERVTASDIESAYLNQAHKLRTELENLEVIEDDICNSQLAAGVYDLVLCTEVIEHIANSEAALRGIHDRLAPDGKLVLSTPQRYSPLEVCAKVAFLPGIIQCVRLIYGEAIEETGHINLLTEHALKQQLGRARLRIIDHHKSGFYLPLIAEFAGKPGLALMQFMERKLRHSWASGLLWTQYYVIEKDMGHHA